jgi:hypothetical protein
MSEGQPRREPDSGDTQEFEAIKLAEGVDARTEFEMVGNYRLLVTPDFRHPIELKLGRDEQTPACYLIKKPWNRKFSNEYIIVQPEVFRADSRRGWVELGDAAMTNHVGLGRLVSPQFELGPDVSRRHCMVAIGTSLVDGNSDVLEIESYGRNGLRVSVHPDDTVQGLTVPGIEAFDPAKQETWEGETENRPQMDREAQEALRHVEEEAADNPEANAEAVDGMLKHLGLNLD